MIIALVGLIVVNIPFLTVMGLAAAGTVAIAVLIAITLLPAILGLRRAPRARAATACSTRGRGSALHGARHDERALGAVRHRAAARRAARRLALLVAIALPALHMKLGLPDGGSQPTTTTERRPTTC